MSSLARGWTDPRTTPWQDPRDLAWIRQQWRERARWHAGFSHAASAAATGAVHATPADVGAAASAVTLGYPLDFQLHPLRRDVFGNVVSCGVNGAYLGGKLAAGGLLSVDQLLGHRGSGPCTGGNLVVGRFRAAPVPMTTTGCSRYAASRTRAIGTEAARGISGFGGFRALMLDNLAAPVAHTAAAVVVSSCPLQVQFLRPTGSRANTRRRAEATGMTSLDVLYCGHAPFLGVAPFEVRPQIYCCGAATRWRRCARNQSASNAASASQPWYACPAPSRTTSRTGTFASRSRSCNCRDCCSGTAKS